MQGLGSWLGRVEAPPELWDRVSRAQQKLDWSPKGRPHSGAWLLARNWALPGLLLVVAALAFFIPRDLHSGDPSQIRTWVLSKTGINVPLPPKLSPSVRLVSASRRDSHTAQIAYQVNGQDAVLLVSLASAAVAGDGRHRSLSRTTSRDAHSSSWTMRGLVYTVSCPSAEVTEVACQLCHSL